MKVRIVLLMMVVFLFAFTCCNSKTEEAKSTVTITGKVTDFENNPVDSALVEVKCANFDTAYETYTDKNGDYSINLEKGKYLAIASMRMDEYPIAGSVLPQEDQRLEFWGWNFIADRDTVLNIRYHRLEVYGVNVFRIQGAFPGYTIYCRPMSLTRYLSFSKEELAMADLSPDADWLEVKVDVNGVPLKVNMKKKVEEYVDGGKCYGYLLHVDLPKSLNSNPYDVFRIEMTDLENGDRGEALYYKEKEGYK